MRQTSGVFIYFILASVCLLTFCCGAGFSWTSPVLPKLKNKNPHVNPLSQVVTPSQVAWLVSLTLIGCALGPIFSGRLADGIGRRKTLQCCAIPLIAAYVVLAIANNVYTFYVGRLVLGIGIGGVYQVIFMYLGEICEPSNRGQMICSLQIVSGLGTLSAYIIGPYLSVKYFSLFYVIPLIMFLGCSVLLPESPIHLLIEGSKDEAEKSLMKLRSKPESAVKEELASLEEFCEKMTCKVPFLDIFKSKGLTRAFTISCGVAMLTQLTGYMPVMAFTHTIFKAAGNDIPLNIQPIIIGTVKCISAIFQSAVIEKCGRKILLLISSMGCGISLTLLGTFFHLQTNEYDVRSITWLPLACLIFYMISYSLGFLSISAVFLSELFPSNVKASASNAISASCYVCGFVALTIFPHLVELLGMAAIFWLFAIFCGLGVLFCQVVVFETKGKSLAEIQDILNSKI